MRFDRQSILELFRSYCFNAGYSAEEVENFISERQVEGTVGYALFHVNFIDAIQWL